MAAVTTSLRDSGHAVSRSNELLACARTALRLAQEQQVSNQIYLSSGVTNNSDSSYSQHAATTSPSDLHLWSPSVPSSSSSDPFNDPYQRRALEQDDAIYLALSPPERALHDASQLLDVLDSLVVELQSLVRRRGHTNDPTEAIGTCMRRFQSLMSEYVKEVEAIPSTIISAANRARNKQMSRHYEMVAHDLLSQGKQKTGFFQKALEKRSEVLKEQAQRRKILSTGATESGAAATTFASADVGNNGRGSTGASYRYDNIGVSSKTYGTLASSFYSASSTPSHLDAPLFTRTTGSSATMNRRKAATTVISSSSGTPSAPLGGPDPSVHEKRSMNLSETSSLHSSLNSSGMRQRRKATDDSASNGLSKHATGSTYSSSAYASAYKSTVYDPYEREYTDQSTAVDENDQTQIQLEHRRQARETKARLENARVTERAVYELGTMFSKMATLIHSQAQQVEKIEDDVELAHHDVTGGHEEITKLFDITKGNRGLIIKVFAILILMILFLRLY